MEEKYPSNSNKLKEASLIRESTEIRTAPISETVEVEKSSPKARPEGIVRTRNISTAKAVFAALFPDGVAGLKDKFIWEMLVPRLQSFLYDGWNDVGDVLFQGGGRSRQNGYHTSYDSMYRGANTSARRADENQYSYRGVYNYQEVVYRQRSQAERLLRTLTDILARYGVITLLDYNEEVGNQTYPSQVNYGWISLNTARIDRTYDGGWVLVMPRPVEIDTRN